MFVSIYLGCLLGMPSKQQRKIERFDALDMNARESEPSRIVACGNWSTGTQKALILMRQYYPRVPVLQVEPQILRG